MSHNIVVTPEQLYKHCMAKSSDKNEIHLLTTIELREIIRLAKGESGHNNKTM